MVENNGGKSSASAKAVAFCSAKQGGLIMGIIRAITQAIGGGLADQWLEVYEADDMGDNTVFTSGEIGRASCRERV